MKKKTFAILAALLTFISGVVIAKLSFQRAVPPPPKGELHLGNYRLSGPYQHENLTIFLIHGPDQTKTEVFTPLQEAMERKVVVVKETREVNELAIENVSASEEVFVQAGDIVKGGQQDRVLSVDLIVPAKSGLMPIAAFCVEHGRWTRRGTEGMNQFSMSDGMVATKELKMAMKRDASQTRVWSEVADAQEKLSNSVARDVRSPVSSTSLQLAQENEEVQHSAAAYVDKLAHVVDSSSDVIGFAFAINNELNSADVYSSHALFERFWPRLLKTAAIEAVAERASTARAELVSVAAAGEFLNASENGEVTLDEITSRTHIWKRESEKGLFFETRDMDHDGAWVHRSYLTK